MQTQVHICIKGIAERLNGEKLASGVIEKPAQGKASPEANRRCVLNRT